MLRLATIVDAMHQRDLSPKARRASRQGNQISRVVFLYLISLCASMAAAPRSLASSDADSFGRSISERRFFLPALGRIECKLRGFKIFTSATLVEDHHTLLTVSHFNLTDTKEGFIPARHCEFQLINNHEEIYFRSNVLVMFRGSNEQNIKISRATDWAILKLVNPAPSSIKPILLEANTPLVKFESVDIVAYDKDHAGMRRQYLIKDCRPSPQSPRSIILIHECSTSLGASGAPLIIRSEGIARLIAIHAGRSADGGVAVQYAGYIVKAMSNRRHPQESLAFNVTQ